MSNDLSNAAITRRSAVKSAGLAVLGAAAAAAGARPAVAQPRGATFVLLHGAWHGGWCWQRLTPLLREAGHAVHTPTFTGLGEREHLANREIGLTTHILDVANLLYMEDLKDVILVAHSYAGIVAGGVADRDSERIKLLVYLNAFVPEDGKSLLDYIPPGRREPYEAPGKETGFFESFPLQSFGMTDPGDVAWAQPRIRRQSYPTFAEKLHLTRGPLTLPQVYVNCRDPDYPSAAPFVARYRDAPGWRYAEVSGGHNAMITNPRGLAGALLKLV